MSKIMDICLPGLDGRSNHLVPVISFSRVPGAQEALDKWWLTLSITYLIFLVPPLISTFTRCLTPASSQPPCLLELCTLPRACVSCRMQQERIRQLGLRLQEQTLSSNGWITTTEIHFLLTSRVHVKPQMEYLSRSTPLHSRAKGWALFRTNLTHNRERREKGKHLKTFKRVGAHHFHWHFVGQSKPAGQTFYQKEKQFSCMDEFKKIFWTNTSLSPPLAGHAGRYLTLMSPVLIPSGWGKWEEQLGFSMWLCPLVFISLDTRGLSKNLYLIPAIIRIFTSWKWERDSLKSNFAFPPR